MSALQQQLADFQRQISDYEARTEDLENKVGGLPTGERDPLCTQLPTLLCTCCRIAPSLLPTARWSWTGPPLRSVSHAMRGRVAGIHYIGADPLPPLPLPQSCSPSPTPCCKR